MKLEVQQVIIPVGSSIGYVVGPPVDDHTKVVVAAGDTRMLFAIGEAMAEADGPVVVDAPDWSIVRIYELPD